MQTANKQTTLICSSDCLPGGAARPSTGWTHVSRWKHDPTQHAAAPQLETRWFIRTSRVLLQAGHQQGMKRTKQTLRRAKTAFYNFKFYLIHAWPQKRPSSRRETKTSAGNRQGMQSLVTGLRASRPAGGDMRLVMSV